MLLSPTVDTIRVMSTHQQSFLLAGAMLCGMVALLLGAPPTAAGDPPATTTAPALLPLPDAASQAENLAVLKRVFKDEYAKHTPPQRQTLARTLLTQAAQDKVQPPMQYVMLQQAAELSANAGDAEIACKAIDVSAGVFSIDALQLKVHALAQASSSATTGNDWEGIVNAGLPLLESAVREEQFAQGQAAAQLVENAAVNSKHVGLLSVVQAHTTEFHTIFDAHTAAQAALSTLAAHSQDGPANRNAGIYDCFVRGDWSGGLMHLAEGSDETLKALAVKELAGPQEPLRQLELADRWWDQAETHTGWMQRTIREHACAWYHIAAKSLNGVTLARLNQRLNVNLSATTAPYQKTVNLLALLDPRQDTVEGQWRISNGVLASDDTRNARIAFPYEPPEEYDLRIEFARVQHAGSMAVLLSQHGIPFGWAMGLGNNRACRFESINRRAHAGNPTEVHCELQSDRKYVLLLQVRKDGVTALLDGKLLNQYKTDYKELSRYAPWRMPNEKAIGLGSSGGALLVAGAELVEIGAAGKQLR